MAPVLVKRCHLKMLLYFVTAYTKNGVDLMILLSLHFPKTLLMPI